MGELEKRKGDAVVVGMKLTPECRERLTWIVAKLTKPGDHIIAVHVLLSSASNAALPEKELDPATKQELDNTFEGVLGVYQALCTLKQIKLDIKVVVGASVKEALVDAAKLEDATKLILGTSKCLPTGLSTSLEKYCLKRLPATCSIMIIDQGKVIFEKAGTCSSSGKSVACTQTCSVIRGVKKFSCSSQTVCLENSPDVASSRHSFVSETNFSESERSFPESPVSVLQSNADEEYTSFSLKALRASRSLSYGQSKGQSTLSADHSCDSQEAATSTSSGDEGADSSAKHGWPLRAISLEKVTTSRNLERKLSVVNWAMQLPNRSPQRGVADCSSSARASVSSCSDFEMVVPRARESMLKSRSTQERQLLHEWHCIDGRDDAEDHPVEAEKEPSNKEGNASVMSLSERLHFLCSENMVSTRFTVNELKEATSNFSEGNLVGKGGCSKVYRGVLSNGQTIAVKCLNQLTLNKEHELLTEVEILSTLRHRHVISLLGYCVSGQSRMLVYNFATNGNLEQILLGAVDSPVLEWSARHKIAVGAAEALEYLHDGSPRPVIHRDVKSANILLSSRYEPQLSDFGLAKWAPTSASHITSDGVLGTFGYFAPEYVKYGKLNEKTDVYSFGVVLLELISGRKPLDHSKPKGQENLTTWGRPLLEAGNIEELIDPRIKDDYDVGQVKHMILAAALCLRQSPQFRPRMRRVSKLLCGEEEDMVFWARRELKLSKELDDKYFRDEYGSDCDVRTHLALAMLGVDDDVVSECSADQSSIEFCEHRQEH